MEFKALKIIKEQSIYRNSIYLIVSTGVLAISGFIYWWLAAKLTSSATIGIATSLVSAMIYIGIIGQLGFNVSIIRFLPPSRHPERITNTALTIVSVTALFASIIFIFLFSQVRIVESLGFLGRDFNYIALFTFFMVFSALNIIIESIFIALRQSINVLVKNIILGILKIGLIFPFLRFGGFGVFSAWAMAIAVSVSISFLFLPKYLRHNLRLQIYRSEIKKVAAFSGGNYLASLAGNISSNGLPVLLLAIAGPQYAAYFSIAFSFATLLFSIPVSVCNSLLAEGAAKEREAQKTTLKAIKLIAALLTPAILVLTLFGKNVLYFFGAEYATQASGLLSIMVASSIFFSANTICWALLNLERRVREIVIVLILNSFFTLSLTYLWGRSSPSGVGYAWITGQVITTFLYVLILLVRPLAKRAQFQGDIL